MRPLLIAIEGIDGSGGTTQSRLLAQWFADQGATEVLLTREPSDLPVGRFIRRALDPEDPASAVGDSVFPYLFAADRRDHLDREIVPVLQRGGVVVSDRYLHSSLAYQSLAVGLSTVLQLNADFRRPDLAVFLDLPPETCLARVEARGEKRDRFEALDRLRQVHEAYESVRLHAGAVQERLVRVDASGSVEAVHARIIAAVRPLVQG